MRRALATATWLLFAASMYLIFTEAVQHWTVLPNPGNIGFTLVFVLFAILHGAAVAGWRITGSFFAVAALVSYTLEEIGVRTGWIYGAYHYSDMLGPKLGHVPVLVPLAWFMMIYPSWLVAKALLQGVNTRSPAGLAAQAWIAAMVMTACDTVMDPGMAAAGTWVWERGGSYFGVPLQNYLGWLLTTFIVYLAAGFLWPERRAGRADKLFSALPIVVYAFYGLSCAMPMPRSIVALRLVALFVMVMPGLLALVRVALANGN